MPSKPRILDAADCVVGAIAAIWGPTAPDGVARDYVPDLGLSGDQTSTLLTGRRVFIFPGRYANEGAIDRDHWNRLYVLSGVVVERYVVNGVEQPGTPPKAWVDVRVGFVESIFNYLVHRGLAGLGGAVNLYRLPEDLAELESPYDLNLLLRHHTFFCGFTVGFRELLPIHPSTPFIAAASGPALTVVSSAVAAYGATWTITFSGPATGTVGGITFHDAGGFLTPSLTSGNGTNVWTVALSGFTVKTGDSPTWDFNPAGGAIGALAGFSGKAVTNLSTQTQHGQITLDSFNGNWTSPVTTNNAKVSLWGAGAGGGYGSHGSATSTTSGGGGGGGGACSIGGGLMIQAGHVYPLGGGAGGAGGTSAHPNGYPGPNATFNTSTIVAQGGQGGGPGGLQGLGGQASAGTGTTKTSGGKGGEERASSIGGGGGGAGGTVGNGMDGSGMQGGFGGSPDGGNGGDNNRPGDAPGGGGGGGDQNSTGKAGGGTRHKITY